MTRPRSRWRQFTGLLGWLAATAALVGGFIELLTHGAQGSGTAQIVSLATWGVWIIFAGVYLGELIQVPIRRLRRSHRKAQEQSHPDPALVWEHDERSPS